MHHRQSHAGCRRNRRRQFRSPPRIARSARAAGRRQVADRDRHRGGIRLAARWRSASIVGIEGKAVIAVEIGVGPVNHVTAGIGQRQWYAGDPGAAQGLQRAVARQGCDDIAEFARRNGQPVVAGLKANRQRIFRRDGKPDALGRRRVCLSRTGLVSALVRRNAGDFELGRPVRVRSVTGEELKVLAVGRFAYVQDRHVVAAEPIRAIDDLLDDRTDVPGWRDKFHAATSGRPPNPTGPMLAFSAIRGCAGSAG